MPAALHYSVDGANERKLRETAEAERRTRQRMIGAARNYYLGEQWRPLLSTDTVDHNVTINLCRQVVDRQVAFLFPDMPRLELVEGRQTDDERALNDAWAAVGGVLRLTEMALTGALAGHVFARVHPGDEEDQPVRLVSLDPALVLRWWSPDDVERTLWYEVQYEAGGGLVRQDIVREAGGWRIVDWAYERTSWRKTGETAWNSALGPVVDWAWDALPHRAYGAGEIEHRELNDHVNAVASDISKILHHHGSPRTVVTGGGDVKQVETGPDRLFSIANPDAKVYNLEMQSDLSAAMNYVQMLERAFFAQSRVVRLSGDVQDMQRVTNLGIRALYIDQLAKTEDLRRRFEWGIQEISRRMLALMGRTPQRPRVHWPDPLPQDPLQTVELMERERQLGLVSKATMAHSLRIDWGIEQERMREDEGLTDVLLEQLATAPGFGARANGQPANGQPVMPVGVFE